MTPSALRLGIVSYLNVLPLVEGIDAFFPPVVRATPRELARMMQAREIDAATLPTFDLLRSGHVLLPGCAIACDGPVRSVQLFSRVPLGDVRRVLLDRSSLTSVHLARIVWRELLGIEPEAETSAAPIKPDFDFGGAGFDAAVVIGDVALAWEHRLPHALDLGEAWKRMTGLPFVFAAWVAHAAAAISQRDVAALQACRDLGERSVEVIARRHAESDEAARDLVDYLSRAIRYRLGERELEAMELFREKLVAHGMLDAATPMRKWNAAAQPGS